MNRHQQDISLRVNDWPLPGKSTSYSLDSRIVPDDDALRAYCENKFGEGSLRRGVDHTWEYNRRASAVPSLIKLFTGLLNKSY